MHLLDLTLPDPALNLAMDEALLLAAEEECGPEVLRLWELPSLAVVVGAGGSVAIDVNRAACEAAGVPILRRASGGGTVLLGPGCLCYSLILRTDRAPGLDQIQPSLRYVMDRTLRAIAGIEAEMAGTSDLIAAGRKFSGNAQQRKRDYFLHHGTLLYDFDLGRISELLTNPEREPDYRRGRAHSEFLTNTATTRDELVRVLTAEWQAVTRSEPPPLARAMQLVTEKYGCAEWTHRR